MNYSITETCGCGATFAWTGRFPSEGEQAASKFRREHRHSQSEGTS